MKFFFFVLFFIATLMLFQLNSDFSSYYAERSQSYAVVLPKDAYIGYECREVVARGNAPAAVLTVYNNMDESIWVKVEPSGIEGIEIENQEFEVSPHSTVEVFARISLPLGTYYASFRIVATFENGSAEMFTVCSSKITVERGTSISKILLSGNTTVPILSEERWTFVISVENPRENSTVKDTIPGEFDIVSYSASTGSVSILMHGRAKHIFWTLSETGNLTVTIKTSLNPAGKQEFTSSGEYYLNNGAELDNMRTLPIIVHALHNS